MTAGNPSYANLDDFFRGHHAVDHDKQFVRAVIIHTNFAESYHSLLKRGLFGAFDHVSAEHLHRYVNFPVRSALHQNRILCQQPSPV
jgi:hypothetical protein